MSLTEEKPRGSHQENFELLVRYQSVDDLHAITISDRVVWSDGKIIEKILKKFQIIPQAILEGPICMPIP